MNKNLKTILTIVSLTGAAALHAETLEQLTSEALRNNPELQVLEASVGSAKGEVTTARTWQNPELNVAPGMRRTKEAGATNKEFHGEASLSQLFLFPGKRALLIAIAQRNVEARKLAIEGLRFQLATAVRRAFYEFLAAQKTATLRREQVQSADLFAQAAEKRAESGYASDFETVKGQSDLINARKLLRSAEGDMATARIELNALTGRLPSAPLEVSGMLETAPPTRLNGAFLALALTRNPSLRTQLIEAEVAGLNLRKTRFGRRPDFAIGPSAEYTENEQTYGISATVALPIWNSLKGEIQTATAEQRKALAEIEKLRLEITSAVNKAVARSDVARDQLALYSPGFLDRLKGFMTQAEKSYAQNATTLLIFLDAKRTYFDTLADYYETLARVAASRAELESAIGVPLNFTSETDNP